MKKFLLVLLVLVLVVSAIPMTLFNVSAVTSGKTGDCTWTLDGTVLTISGNGEMGFYYDGSYAPWGRYITEVIIEEGVTEIGPDSFFKCRALKSVKIPKSVTHIGSYAFEECVSLENINLGDGLQTMSEGVFNDCISLKSVTIPASLEKIMVWTFLGCDSLTDIYYRGSEQDKKLLIIECSKAKKVTWHYNSCIGRAEHIYSNDCDTSCNGCEFSRTITHTYDNACDNTCNVCGTNRDVPDHIYDDNCDAYCNECQAEREVEHDFNEKYKCKVCGYIPYTIGDLNDDDVVDTTDLAMLKLKLAGIE